MEDRITEPRSGFGLNKLSNAIDCRNPRGKLEMLKFVHVGQTVCAPGPNSVVRIHIDMKPACGLLLRVREQFRWRNEPNTLTRKVNERDVMSGRISRNPPVKCVLAPAAARLGLQVGFNLDGYGVRQGRRVSNKVNPSVSAHWRGLNATQQQLILHQQLAALADLSCG